MDFFTSDTHFFHKNIISHCNRPFANVDEMNAELIARWNETVSPGDRVFHLGDVSFAGVNATREIISQLNGHKVLLRGNHDRNCDKMMEIGFDEAYGSIYIQVPLVEKPSADISDSVILWMAHVPPDNRYDNRPLERPPMNERMSDLISMGYDYIPLCGHVHSSWKTFKGAINVGVDMWDYRPITVQQILALREECFNERMTLLKTDV